MVIEIPVTSVDNSSHQQKSGLMRVEMDDGIFRIELTIQGEHVDTVEGGWAELTEGLAALNRINNFTKELARQP